MRGHALDHDAVAAVAPAASPGRGRRRMRVTCSTTRRGSPSTMPCTSKRSAPVVPGSTVPADVGSVSRRRAGARAPRGSRRARRRAPRPGCGSSPPQAKREGAGHEQQRRLVQGLPKPMVPKHHLGLVVGGVVHDLLDADLAPALAQPREHQRQHVVGEARIDARWSGTRRGRSRQASSRSPLNVGSRLVGCTSATTELDTTFLPARRMRAMSFTASHRSQVGGGGVADAVGVEREQRFGVVGRGDAHRGDAAQLAGVAAGLLLAVDAEPGQLELGVAEDGAQGVACRRCRCSTG